MSDKIYRISLVIERLLERVEGAGLMKPIALFDLLKTGRRVARILEQGIGNGRRVARALFNVPSTKEMRDLELRVSGIESRLFRDRDGEE